MQFNKNPRFKSIFSLLIVLSVFCSCKMNHHFVELHDDSGWCWYQDERAIIDGDQLVFSGVNADSANIVSSYNLETGEKETFVLKEHFFPLDDHNVGALLLRPDGRYLTVYAGHGVDNMMRYRISTRPGDISQWEEEGSIDVGARNTYSNVYRLDKSGRTYNFHRGRGWDPNYMVSDDEGESWRYGGQLFSFQGRPYVKYASDSEGRIHFTTTEEHPRNYNNGIYHGYMEDGLLFRSDGYEVGHLSTDTVSRLSPLSFTTVFEGGGDVRADVAWTSDMELDEQGYPYMAFSVTKDPIPMRERKNIHQGGFDHRYHYARWDGKQWHEYEIAYAGTRLYPGENEYTGLITLHPHNPNVVYISTDVDPKSGEPLMVNGTQRREIFRGSTRNGGATWKWKPITKNSSEDNIRPIVLDYKGKELVIWLQGRYTTYRDYDLKVMGLVPR